MSSMHFEELINEYTDKSIANMSREELEELFRGEMIFRLHEAGTAYDAWCEAERNFLEISGVALERVEAPEDLWLTDETDDRRHRLSSYSKDPSQVMVLKDSDDIYNREFHMIPEEDVTSRKTFQLWVRRLGGAKEVDDMTLDCKVQERIVNAWYRSTIPWEGEKIIIKYYFTQDRRYAAWAMPLDAITTTEVPV